MLERDPTTYGLLTYAWVLALSMWGGVVNTLSRARSGHEPLTWIILVADISVAAFAGILTFWLTQAAEINPLYGAAMVGIAGHMGAKIIFFFESGLQRWASGFTRAFVPEDKSDDRKDVDK